MKKGPASTQIPNFYFSPASWYITPWITSLLLLFPLPVRKAVEHIDELFLKTNATPKSDKMDFSRYPFSNDYVDHFYVNKYVNEEVDLENFVARFKVIHEKLKDASTY